MNPVFSKCFSANHALCLLFCLSHSFPFQVQFLLTSFPSWLVVCFLSLFLRLPGMLHLILDCTWCKDVTFSSASLEVSLCWLPSGNGGIFLSSSAVCWPLLVGGVQMSIPQYQSRQFQPLQVWEMYLIWEGRKSVSLEEFLFNGYISVQVLERTILHTLMDASLTRPIRF